MVGAIVGEPEGESVGAIVGDEPEGELLGALIGEMEGALDIKGDTTSTTAAVSSTNPPGFASAASAKVTAKVSVNVPSSTAALKEFATSTGSASSSST